jgi:glycosyltransferase involved in cell wall biosynthesis
MNIGIDISQIIYSGGVGVYLKNLVKNLSKIDHKNQYVLFGTSLRKKNILEGFFKQIKKSNFNKKFYCLPSTIDSFLFNQLRFPRIELLLGRIDLFHSSDWTEPKSSCSKVTTIHDLAPLIYPQLHDPRIVAVFKRKLDLVKKESTLIISVSQRTKKDLVQRLGIAEEKIKVIYEALDEEFVQVKADENFVNSLNLKKFIISDAIKNPRKNLKNLLKAFVQLKDRDLKLVLVGEPMWDKEKILHLINDSSIKDKIINLKFVSAGQLKALYKNALMAVFPSFYEGFGLSILEAMSGGCPVICSNSSSFPEVAGRAALFVNPYKPHEITQAIKKITYNILIYYKLQKAGFKQVKKFSWQKAARKTLKVYEEVGK